MWPMQNASSSASSAPSGPPEPVARSLPISESKKPFIDDPLWFLCVDAPVVAGFQLGPPRLRKPECGLYVLGVISAFEIQRAHHLAEPERKTIGELEFKNAGMAGQEGGRGDVALERECAVIFAPDQIPIEGQADVIIAWLHPCLAHVRDQDARGG